MKNRLIKLNMFYKISIYFFLVCSSSISIAQNFDRLNIPFTVNNKILKLPYTGGLKGGQFSNIDFNNDGIKDLFIFDRNGDQIIPLIKTGQPGSIDFIFEPDYISMFPKMRNWALLVDFNKDGIEDIFTSSNVYPGCIEVWKGKRENDRITYKLLTFNYGLPEILQFPITNGYTQIYVSSIDLPAIADVDNDGDMDIVSFEPDGSYASFYKNLSVEENLGLDSLKFDRNDICWGKFSENQFNEQITLSDNAFSCSQGITSGGNSGARHSGSTLCIFDSDGDMDMDVIIGDLASSKLKRLFNGGTLQTAFMTVQETNFPQNDVPVNLDVFIAAYYVDVTGDGKRDLIVTPNEAFSGESENHVWLYKNTGTDIAPIFKFEKNDFLIDEMIFFNSGSHPAFADINNDGLQDIVIGSNGIQRKSGIKENRMYLVINTGTPKNPSFNLENSDYLDFSQLGDLTGRFAPAFGDMDNDGDSDMVIGDVRGFLYYFENASGKNKPMEFKSPVYQYADIFIGQNAKPQIIDLDNDGLNDLVIGEKNNQLNFFKNIGTAEIPLFNNNPSILPNTDKLGNIYPGGNDFDTQSGSPFFIKQNLSLLMLFGIEIGYIMAYDRIENNIYNNFNLKNSKIGNINQGRKVNISLADIDDDGYYEMAVGNERGGLVFYNTEFKKDSISSLENPSLVHQKKLLTYPNPFRDYLNIIFSGNDAKMTILNMDGSPLMILKNGLNENLSQLKPGMYVIQIIEQQQAIYRKVIKI